MKYDLDTLNYYLGTGHLEKCPHPTLPLVIWNYSRDCQYAKDWDAITMACRGLVLDQEGNVIARPFRKFFNYEEWKPELLPPFGDCEIYEKMDGSLGILFYYADEWHLATKGSFTSDQAIKGKEILQKYKYKYLPTDCTYLFEIIYPENRIVVDYGSEEKLVLLAAIQTDTEEEWDIYSQGYEELGFELVKKYDAVKDYSDLKSLIKENQEGFVLKFRNGFRIKIKGEEYVRLHRLLTNFSNVDIWELMRDGMDINNFLEKVPDEFDSWVRNTVMNLAAQFSNIERDYKEYYEDICQRVGTEDRKAFAEEAKRYNHSSILFSMLTGKDYSGYIWKLIRPTYQKPFWNSEL
jgi:RNA ligase